MIFTTSSPTYSIHVRRSYRLMALFDPNYSSPCLGNLVDPIVSHDPIHSIRHDHSHSFHDEDESLRVPP